MQKNIMIIASLVLLILISGCNGPKKVSDGSAGGSELLFQYRWDVTELEGEAVLVSAEKQPNLLFYPGQVSRVSGNTGCNMLNGSFELVAGNAIQFSPLITTKKACLGDNVEAKLLAVLEKINTWNISDNQLLLKNGKALLAKLKAVPVESAKLFGDWELNYLSGPRIAFDGLYPDKKPRINFKLATNELGGNTSCNGFSSKIIIDGNKITIAEPFAKTIYIYHYR